MHSLLPEACPSFVLVPDTSRFYELQRAEIKNKATSAKVYLFPDVASAIRKRKSIIFNCFLGTACMKG